MFVDTLSRVDLFPSSVKLFTDIELLLRVKKEYVPLLTPSHGSMPPVPSNMDIFRSLRDRHVKWMAVPHSEKPVQSSNMLVKREGGAEISAVTLEYSFVYAVMHSVDPSICLISLPDRDRCIIKFVERAVIGISSDSTGLVKRFRKSTGIHTPTIADMTSTLYDVTNVFRDDNINDLAVFYIAAVLKTSILITSSSCAKLYPLDANVDDSTIVVDRGTYEQGSFCVRAIGTCGEHTAPLSDAYKILASEWWEESHQEASQVVKDGEAVKAYARACKCTTLRDVMQNRIGILTNKQMTQLHSRLFPGEESPRTAFTKSAMTDVIHKLIAL